MPGLGHIRLARLTADDVDALLEARAASGLARSSVSGLRTVLGTALDHAVRPDMVRRNVARLTKVPPGSTSTRRSLSPVEARALLDAVSGDRLEALIVTGVALGLRPGELLGLSWRDVDLDAGLVHLRQQLKRENNRPVLGDLKTARSRRSLRCPPVVVDALRRRRKLQEEAGAAPRLLGDGEGSHEDAHAPLLAPPVVRARPARALIGAGALVVDGGDDGTRTHDPLLANRAARRGRGAWPGARWSRFGLVWPSPVGACGPCVARAKWPARHSAASRPWHGNCSEPRTWGDHSWPG